LLGEHKESLDDLERREGCPPEGPGQWAGEELPRRGPSEERGWAHPRCPRGRLGTVFAGPWDFPGVRP